MPPPLRPPHPTSGTGAKQKQIVKPSLPAGTGEFPQLPPSKGGCGQPLPGGGAAKGRKGAGAKNTTAPNPATAGQKPADPVKQKASAKKPAPPNASAPAVNKADIPAKNENRSRSNSRRRSVKKEGENNKV